MTDKKRVAPGDTGANYGGLAGSTRMLPKTMIPEYRYTISREYSRLYWTVKALWRDRDLRFYRQSLRNNISQMREERKRHVKC